MGNFIAYSSNIQAAFLAVLFSTVAPLFAQVEFETDESRVVVCLAHHPDLMQSFASEKTPPEDWLKVFRVSEDNNELRNSKRPMMGTYSAESGQIIFQPLVPFSPGLSYVARLGDSISYNFHFDLPDEPETRLINIYPTTDTVPENLLKIYLEFSGRMREGQVYEKVSLRTEDGLPVKNPFVPLQPELWDASGTTLTLWIDPGRVKRKLASSETHGPVLEAGRRYQLVIDSSWQDGSGRTLPKAYQKSLLVKSADRKVPNIAGWHINSPQGNTADPLMIRFDEPMDMSTSYSAITVVDSVGRLVDGEINLDTNEKTWNFNPSNNWKTGEYSINIKSILEDLAGNNLNRKFDRDLKIDTEPLPSKDSYEIKFEVL